MTRLCPACGEPILVAAASRWGGHDLPFDPEPGTGRHYDTMLSADLSHVIASYDGNATAMQGKIPLYRGHVRSCPKGLKVPMDKALPDIGGYRHMPAVKAS